MVNVVCAIASAANVNLDKLVVNYDNANKVRME